jgi:ParB family chromosome partitioning protein
MTKQFLERKSKKERSFTQLPTSINRDLLRVSDEKLLRGAKLSDVPLGKITVREQVRTKFNDASLKELAENIKVNGLIQPLVIHRENDKFVLLCGERRLRAMNLIKMKEAPCFILEGKSKEELMAIQFSENSAREELHFIDKSDGIYNYQVATGSSERKIMKDLGISKTEVHRSLLLAKLEGKIKEAAKVHNVEKYVLLEFDAITDSKIKDQTREKILSGEVTKRSELKRVVKSAEAILINPGKKGRGKNSVVLDQLDVPRGITAKAFVKAMDLQTKNLNLDEETLRSFRRLIKDTSELIDKK